MGQGKKTVAVALLLLSTSCGKMLEWNPFNIGKEDEQSTVAPPAVESSATYAVALGGVAEGRDKLVIYNSDGTARDFSNHTLVFRTDNDNVLLEPRAEFANFGDGSGARIIPQKVGTTVISPEVDGIEEAEKFSATVPPQSLVQILIGEARGQIAAEAQTEDGRVKLASVSTTANAIGAVVRNRVLLMEAAEPLSTFVVDSVTWNADPPGSHWDAVIEAEAGGVYQFSPLDSDTESFEYYQAAAKRSELAGEADLVAYDQAVLTAAGIFNNSIADPTGGAFAFRTPTESEATCLQDALISGPAALPSGCGPGDDNYPAFAPIQVLVHPGVALLSEGRPSFVFIRNRSEDDPVVTNLP